MSFITELNFASLELTLSEYLLLLHFICLSFYFRALLGRIIGHGPSADLNYQQIIEIFNFLVDNRGFLVSFMPRILVKVFNVLNTFFTDNDGKSLVAYIIAVISVSLQRVLNSWNDCLEKP